MMRQLRSIDICPTECVVLVFERCCCAFLKQVADVKREVERVMKVPVEQQLLVHLGNVLDDASIATKLGSDATLVLLAKTATKLDVRTTGLLERYLDPEASCASHTRLVFESWWCMCVNIAFCFAC